MRKKNWIEFSNKNFTEEHRSNKSNFSKNNKIKIFTEKKGKRGKTITIVSGLDMYDLEIILELLKKLKIFCGTGGTLTDSGIQLQGDMCEKVRDYLRKDGYLI